MGKRQELSPWNLRDWLVLLWWVLVRPDRLKAYEDLLENRGEERLKGVGSWLVSTLTWLPLLIAGLWIGNNRAAITPAIAVDGFQSALYGLLPWLLIGAVVLWLLSGLSGSWREDKLSAPAIIGEASVGLGVGFVAVSTASILALSRLVLSVAISVAVSVAFGVSSVPAGRVVRGASVMAAFGAMLGTVLSAAFAAFIVPSVSAVMFLLAFTLITAVVSAVDSGVETGRPSWIGRLTFMALLLSYGVLFWQLTVGLLG